MQADKKLPFPIKLLVLDMLGLVLVGLGLAHHFAGLDFLPDGLRFENSGLFMAVAGFALMLPLMLHVLGKALNKLNLH